MPAKMHAIISLMDKCLQACKERPSQWRRRQERGQIDPLNFSSWRNSSKNAKLGAESPPF